MFFNSSHSVSRRLFALSSLFTLLALIPLTTRAGIVPIQHVVDFDGNGRTDFAVGRLFGSQQIRWLYSLNPTGTTGSADWGLELDEFVPEDYDGDGRTDIAVWRPGSPATFYILQSQTTTVRAESLGQTDDDPSVVGDYNNDGRADLAVYRYTSGTWFFRTTPGGATSAVAWGTSGDFPAPGDYDGDGSNDFVIQRNNGNGQAAFWRLFSGGGSDVVLFGIPTDLVVPGDYDADGKTDLAVVRRFLGGPLVWYWRLSSNSAIFQTAWGSADTDRPTQGDYDGDGKTDVAIWRGTTGVFWVLNSSNSSTLAYPWGTVGDYPIANYNVH